MHDMKHPCSISMPPPVITRQPGSSISRPSQISRHPREDCSILRFVTSTISHHTRRQEWKAQGGVCPGYLADSARDDRCLGKDPTHAPSHTRRLTVLAFIIPAILPNVVVSIATPLCKKMMLGGCVVPILNVAAGSSTLHSLYPLYSSTILQSQSKRSRGKPRGR
jgi:hypothetical protein